MSMSNVFIEIISRCFLVYHADILCRYTVFRISVL